MLTERTRPPSKDIRPYAGPPLEPVKNGPPRPKTKPPVGAQTQKNAKNEARINGTAMANAMERCFQTDMPLGLAPVFANQLAWSRIGPTNSASAMEMHIVNGARRTATIASATNLK